MKEKEFCENCRKSVNYTVCERNATTNFNNTEVNYIEKYATCNNCGGEIFVDKLNDINLLEMQKQYRVVNKIISKEGIEKLCKSLHTDKRSLSKLLGWKETLLEDYCSGKYLPTVENSDLLKEMHKKNRIVFFLGGTYLYVEESLVYDTDLVNWFFTCCDTKGKRYLVLATDPVENGRYIIIQPKISDLLSMIEGKIEMRDIYKTVSSFWEVFVHDENIAKDCVKKKSISEIDNSVLPFEGEYYDITDTFIKKYCQKLKKQMRLEQKH